MSDKDIIEQRMQKLITMTAGFCDAYVDDDYKQLCEKLTRKMSRKRNVPFLSGRIEIWAAAIIHALGSINFLFDPNFEPYVGAADISDYFGTSKSTVSQKAKVIRDMFKMGYWDNEFSTTHMQKSNPASNLVMAGDMILDVRSLPPDIQEALIRQKKDRKT